jgi:hypothetical protein
MFTDHAIVYIKASQGTGRETALFLNLTFMSVLLEDEYHFQQGEVLDAFVAGWLGGLARGGRGRDGMR